MSTVAAVVGRAFRLLRVIDINEEPEAQQMENAIFALNALMQSIEAKGLTVGWADVSQASEEMPTPPELDRGIAANLAADLRAEYGTELDPDVLAMAEAGMALIRQQIEANTYRRLAFDLPVAEGDCYVDSNAFYRGW